jgi:hypothetical protein
LSEIAENRSILAYDLQNRYVTSQKWQERQNIGFIGDTAVVAPISNDKILPSDSNNGPVTGKKRADQGSTNQRATSSEALSQDEASVETESVDVERANQVYSKSKANPTSGENRITSPDQAKSLVAEIRTQIEANAELALKAQTGAAANSLPALLEAAPV